MVRYPEGISEYLSVHFNAAAFTFDYAETNRLFLDAPVETSRYYRLRVAGQDRDAPLQSGC